MFFVPGHGITIEVTGFTGWDWWCWHVLRRIGFKGYALRYIVGRLAFVHGFPKTPPDETWEPPSFYFKMPDGIYYRPLDGSGRYDIV